MQVRAPDIPKPKGWNFTALFGKIILSLTY